MIGVTRDNGKYVRCSALATRFCLDVQDIVTNLVLSTEIVPNRYLACGVPTVLLRYLTVSPEVFPFNLFYTFQPWKVALLIIALPLTRGELNPVL